MGSVDYLLVAVYPLCKIEHSPHFLRNVMKLYHATPRRNLASIFTDGLLTSKSETKRCAVYLFDSIESVGWAKEHVAERHKCTVGDVVILKVFDGNPKLRRAAEILRMSGLPGIWYCTHDIPAGCIEVLDQE